MPVMEVYRIIYVIIIFLLLFKGWYETQCKLRYNVIQFSQLYPMFDCHTKQTILGSHFSLRNNTSKANSVVVA